MNTKTFTTALVLGLTLQIGACSTTSGVIVSKSAPKASYSSVYIVAHGGNGADMDANLQKDFLRHGMTVTAGAEGAAPATAELIARYADNWRWDMAMYLRSLDLMLYDGKTNALLASGSWKNSTLHGFYSSEKVVTNVVDDTLSKVVASP